MPVQDISPRRATGLALVLPLALAFAAMRGIGALGPTGLRWLLPLGFVLMMLSPWLLLDAAGRRRIGLRRPDRWRGVVPALALGALAALLCGVLGLALFDRSADHWFVGIADGYRQTFDTSHLGLVMLYLVFTAPALLFSPIGEEIFFRGLLQDALERRFGDRIATTLECAAFGVVHLCHHGLFVAASGALALRPASGAVWMLLMFATAWLFAAIRRRSGSLYPAMAAHAAFNAAMNAFIFGVLW